MAGRLLDFWRFFRGVTGGAAGGALSVRDLLAWAGFVNATAPRIGALAAYAHGAHLVVLDGIGLGFGLPLVVPPFDLSPFALRVMELESVTQGIAPVLCGKLG